MSVAIETSAQHTESQPSRTAAAERDGGAHRHADPNARGNWNARAGRHRA